MKRRKNIMLRKEEEEEVKISTQSRKMATKDKDKAQ